MLKIESANKQFLDDSEEEEEEEEKEMKEGSMNCALFFMAN